MAFELFTPPGIIDIPDSFLSAGSLASGFTFSALKENAAFGSVVPEVFFGVYENGQTVPLPISPVDGYQYEQAELIYCWEVYSTLPLGSSSPSSQGALRANEWYVEQNTGIVHCTEIYVIGNAKGGNSTNDGQLGVWTVGVRGRTIRTLAAQPNYTDLASSVFSVDNAATQTNLVDLSHNAKRGSVQCEVFAANPSNAPVWQQNTAYNAGQLVQPTQKAANGFWFVAANTGISGPIEPNWNSIYRSAAPNIDGGMVWNIAGAGFLNGQQVVYPQSGVDGYDYSASDLIVAHLAFISTESMPVQFFSGVIDTSGAYPMAWCKKSLTSTQPSLPTATTDRSFAQLQSRLGGNYTTQYTRLPPNLQLGQGTFVAPPAMALASPPLAPGATATGVGIVNCGVMYSNGFFNDGTVMVTLFCFRNLAAMASPGGANFVDFSTIQMSTGNALPGLPASGPPAANMGSINENAKFSILRPEVFLCEYNASSSASGYLIQGPEVIAGGQVPTPISPIDGYAYNRSELTYLWYFNQSAGPRCVQELMFGVYVDPNSGVINSTVQYIGGGDATAQTNYGNVGTLIYGAGGLLQNTNVTTANAPGFGQIPVTVIVFARRQHETELQATAIIATTPQPAQPGSTNLLPNGGFEIWSTPNPNFAEITGCADDWFQNWDQGGTIDQDMGISTAIFQFPGQNAIAGAGPSAPYNALDGSFSQCIAVVPSAQNNNAATDTNSRKFSPLPNGSATVSIVSEIIPIWPGGEYDLSFLAAAYATTDFSPIGHTGSPEAGVSPDYIGAGFYARVHLLGASTDGSGTPDMGTDTLFELLCDQPNGTSLQFPAGLVAGTNNGYGVSQGNPSLGASGNSISPPLCVKFDFTFAVPGVSGASSVGVAGLLLPGNLLTPTSSVPSAAFDYQTAYIVSAGSSFSSQAVIHATQQANWSFNASQYAFAGSQLRTAGGVPLGTTTNYVIVTGFNLGVPSTATITGVQVDLNWLGQSAGSGEVVGVSLYYLGSQYGTIKAPNSSNFSVPNDLIQGSSTDLWGASVSPSVANDPSFGFGVQIETVNSPGRSFINYMAITVFYGGGSSSPGSTVVPPPPNSALCSTSLPATGPIAISFVPAFMYVEFLLWDIWGTGYGHLRCLCLDDVVLQDLTTGTASLIGLSTTGSSTGISAQGNLVGYASMSFTYVSTPSSIAITWPSATVVFASGQTLTISGGSYTIVSVGTGSTGLSPSTVYDITAAVNVVSGTIQDITAWANPTSGAPSVVPASYITQVINADNSIGLLAGGPGAQASTPASGTGSGGGQSQIASMSPRS